jgi:hypothetical protein
MQTVLSLFLFVAAIVYVEYRLRGVSKRLDDDQLDANSRFATKEGLNATTEKLTLKQLEELRALDERMTSLEQRTFFNQPDNLAVANGSQGSGTTVADPDVIYFRWPADDGSFDDKARLTVQTEDTYYEFSLHDDRSKADVRFVTMTETQLNKANNSSKKYIERACNFTGAKSIHYICHPGTAHLERGRWYIDDKVRIEYC